MRRALALRRAYPALRGPFTRVLHASGPVFAYARASLFEGAVVAFNTGERAANVSLDLRGSLAEGATLVDVYGQRGGATVRRGRVSLALEPRSAAILVPARDARRNARR
jgi:hypothetical protein